jgi:hypothetical protein
MNIENMEECLHETVEYTPPVIFTRYLYILDDVKTAFMLSILNRNADESLFWTYELYYSGYIDDVFDLVTNIYNEFYSVLNPNLGLFFIQLQNDWNTSNDDTIIGTMVHNLIHRKYNISSFVEKYSKTPFNLVYPSPENDRKFFIILQNKDIEKYKNYVLPENKLPSSVLKTVTQYSSHSYSAKLFDNLYITIEREDLLTIYRQDWLYYASFSPIWAERIYQFNAIIDHDKKIVYFQNDDIEDAFYQHYYYDTDEQPSYIQSKSIGTGNETQWTWTDFYQTYNKY